MLGEKGEEASEVYGNVSTPELFGAGGSRVGSRAAAVFGDLNQREMVRAGRSCHGNEKKMI